MRLRNEARRRQPANADITGLPVRSVPERIADYSNRQVFRLPVRHGSRAAFPRKLSVARLLAGLTGYGGGPAADFHRFPFFARVLTPGTYRMIGDIGPTREEK